jgi:hypothetical protein
MERHQQIYDAAQLVLDSEPTDCDEELDEVIFVATIHWKTYNPIRGATASLIASGRMSLISDRTLRNQLAAWDGLVSDLAHDEQHAMEQRAALVGYIALNLPDWDCHELVSDASFIVLLNLRQFAEEEILSEENRISEAVDNILAKTESFAP